ncbi:hypothetical protein BGX29_003732 [Mortierella sp. GBA35]|nr:hypothetical protein BGX29_003732 [Mortierella sp. GBA35]
MKPPKELTSKNTVPRPSNFDYCELVDSVNRALTDSHEPSYQTRVINLTQDFSMASVMAGLTEEELRRINGPNPATTCSFIVENEITEKLGNTHLYRNASAAVIAVSDTFLAMHSSPYHHPPPPLPPKALKAKRQSLSLPIKTSAPHVHPQGPRPKPPKAGGIETGSGVGTTALVTETAWKCEVRVRPFDRHSVDMKVARPSLRERYPNKRRSTSTYIRNKQDLQAVNQSLESWMFNPLTIDREIEKAFQKQQGIFQNAKVAGKKSVKNNRWYKEVGLGFKTPKEAIEGHYIDKKCPFTGDVSIRGRILTGEIISTKMKRTIIIRREYLHFISKYNRYEKRHKNLAAHMSPAFIGVQQGDSVTVGQCRPLSKTVRFNVLKVQKKVVKGAKNFAKF